MNLLIVGLCIAWLAGGISFTLGIALNRPSKWEVER